MLKENEKNIYIKRKQRGGRKKVDYEKERKMSDKSEINCRRKRIETGI